jgi:hypothetical protein
VSPQSPFCGEDFLKNDAKGKVTSKSNIDLSKNVVLLRWRGLSDARYLSVYICQSGSDMPSPVVREIRELAISMPRHDPQPSPECSSLLGYGHYESSFPSLKRSKICLRDVQEGSVSSTRDRGSCTHLMEHRLSGKINLRTFGVYASTR